jgi:adenosylcobinamide-phosphate synthase
MFSNFYSSIPIIIILALLIDILIGWPNKLFIIIGHPVTWIGKAINFLEKTLNKQQFSLIQKRVLGILMICFLTLPIVTSAIYLNSFMKDLPFYIIIEAILIWPFLAIRSLYTHVYAILLELERDDLVSARIALSKIVGRDVKNLNEEQICKASIESLSESTADGVIAPLFWVLVFGFPGILFYKIVNTLDSMVGYKNERFQDFGWASARLDDLINWIPARLTAILISALTSNPLKAFLFSSKNSLASPSPNAGWPQSAMAYALQISLMGQKSYNGLVLEQASINEYAPSPKRENLRESLKLYKKTIILVTAILIVFSFLWSLNK